MMMGREELAEAFLDESSQCSSGCQSGWTLYLEHSGTSGQQQCRSLPYQSDVQGQVLLQSAESYEEDSMVSDASSGPLPHLPEEEELQVLHGQSMLRQQRRRVSGDHCYYSGSGGRRSSASGSGSRSFGSTRSSSMGEVKSRKKRKAVVQREEAAIRPHGIDDDDDLHDTASSSSVAPLDDAVEAMHCGGDVTELPSCALSDTHYSPEWAPAVRRSTAMQQGYAMLHHN